MYECNLEWIIDIIVAQCRNFYHSSAHTLLWRTVYNRGIDTRLSSLYITLSPIV